MDLIFSALEAGPQSLSELVARTGIPKPTAHRLACALEAQRFLARDATGRFLLGSRIEELATHTGHDPLVTAALPILAKLRDACGQSAQIYRRHGTQRLCAASVEPLSGLRDSVPAGTVLPMTAGSAAQVLIAWRSPEEIIAACEGARFSPAELTRVRRRGWAHTAAEREPGLASISAPVFAQECEVVAAIGVSGPLDRIGRSVRAPLVAAVTQAASEVIEALRAQ